jgi:hypothetical protein
VVSDATRNSLRGLKFQKFSGGARPQTPYFWYGATREISPLYEKFCINPCIK